MNVLILKSVIYKKKKKMFCVRHFLFYKKYFNMRYLRVVYCGKLHLFYTLRVKSKKKFSNYNE